MKILDYTGGSNIEEMEKIINFISDNNLKVKLTLFKPKFDDVKSPMISSDHFFLKFAHELKEKYGNNLEILKDRIILNDLDPESCLDFIKESKHFIINLKNKSSIVEFRMHEWTYNIFYDGEIEEELKKVFHYLDD